MAVMARQTENGGSPFLFGLTSIFCQTMSRQEPSGVDVVSATMAISLGERVHL